MEMKIFSKYCLESFWKCYISVPVGRSLNSLFGTELKESFLELEQRLSVFSASVLKRTYIELSVEKQLMQIVFIFGRYSVSR